MIENLGTVKSQECLCAGVTVNDCVGRCPNGFGIAFHYNGNPVPVRPFLSFFDEKTDLWLGTERTENRLLRSFPTVLSS